MSFYKQYTTIIGVLVLTVVVSILLLPPSMILAQQVTFIDTILYGVSADRTFVRTKMDLGSAEHMRAFPKVIGKWKGIYYETSRIEQELNADVILMRAYQSPSFYQSIFLLIMQSSDPGSFHPPPQCYRALGYQNEEEGEEEIPLLDVDWVSSYWRSETEQDIVSSINVSKLVVFKESNGKVTERRVVIYFYVKGAISKDELTLVRVSALAPVDMSYDGILSLTKDFMGEVVPYLFEFYEEKEEMLAAYLAKSGVGRLLIAVSLLIPVAIMFYPRLRHW